ncbi:MAG TPA: cupredoxin domain-containing protein [Candidatus Limnocylindria bacterium]|jgi:uncharacterized cupredoxin-like copper-binding protein
MKRLATISIAALVLLAACGGAGAPAAQAGGSVAVKLSDSSIGLDRSSVPAGDVMFKITNAGSIPHEFAVLKTDLAADKLPANPDKAGKVLEDGNVGEVEDIAVKETKDLSLNLKPGSYVLICNLPAHYGMGMRVAFTVK